MRAGRLGLFSCYIVTCECRLNRISNRSLNSMRVKGFEVVGASGFEPPTSWSRTSGQNHISRCPGVTYRFSGRSLLDKFGQVLPSCTRFAKSCNAGSKYVTCRADDEMQMLSGLPECTSGK